MKRLKPAYGIKRPIALSFVLLCCAVMLFLSACNLYESAEDKKSDSAKMEEAAIYIDKGQYEKAEGILTKIYDKNPDTKNPRLLQLLSNSISGQIGLDTFNVLKVADDLSDRDIDGGIDLVGMVLGDENDQLQKNEIEEHLDDLYTPAGNGFGDGAIAFLLQIDDRRTSDHAAQIGLLSLIDTVLLIGEIVSHDLDIDPITLTEQGLRDAYLDQGVSFPYNLPDTRTFVVDEPEGFPRIDRINENMERIKKAVDEILFLSGDTDPEDNALTEIFNDFYWALSGSDGGITYESLALYMTNLLDNQPSYPMPDEYSMPDEMDQPL